MDKWNIYATQFILYDYLSEKYTLLYTLNTYMKLLIYNNIKKRNKNNLAQNVNNVISARIKLKQSSCIIILKTITFPV